MRIDRSNPVIKLADGSLLHPVHNGNLVHYAGYTGHIGLYPAPSGLERFGDEIARYKRGKGSVRFPLDEELPIELIRRIVAFRIEEQGGRPRKDGDDGR